MCGITGFVGTGDRDMLEAMMERIHHRGPDDANVYIDRRAYLGFRRLAIIDLISGRQPMSGEDGNVTVVFNGEIYNHARLREILSSLGHHFTTASDTEVIVHGYEAYGEKIFSMLSGMFAIAVWDAREEKLLLARDRLGKKPLYYSLTDSGTFVFGSEPKALLAHGTVKRQLNLEALNLYLTYEFVPTPHSIFESIYKLEPGQYLTYIQGSLKKTSFWNLGDSIREPLSISFTDMLHGLDTHISRAVESRLMSDVPLGVYLSGGLDSSTIAWYAQKLSRVPIDTFTIAFQEESYDESSYAKKVAEALGTRHHEEQLSIQHASSLLTELVQYIDEPLADPSIIPTFLLARFSRKSVTVALGGDGGDELFLGYQNMQAHRFNQWYRLLPYPIRRMCARAAGILPVRDDYFSFPFKVNRFMRGQKHSLFRQDLSWRGAFDDAEKQRLLARPLPGNAFHEMETHLSDMSGVGTYEQLMYLYIKQYLMDDVMVKVDRATMAASQEARAPFLDYELVEYASRIPPQFKLPRGGKYILKKLMEGRLPKEIVWRSKKGFGVPVAGWLRHHLKPLLHVYLSDSYLGAQGIFSVKEVTRYLNDFKTGRRDVRKELWTLLAFQVWYDHWIHRS